MQDNLREELIKQFPAEVVELVEPSGKKFYACPTCKRVVTFFLLSKKAMSGTPKRAALVLSCYKSCYEISSLQFARIFNGHS